MEHVRVNIKFNCVITGSDGLGIKVNVFVSLYALEIIEVDDCPKINENCDCSCSETIDHSVAFQVSWDFTTILNKEISILIAIFRNVRVGFVVNKIQVQIIEMAFMFSRALFFDVGINSVFVEAIIAFLDIIALCCEGINGSVETEIIIVYFLVDEPIVDIVRVNLGNSSIGALKLDLSLIKSDAGAVSFSSAKVTERELLGGKLESRETNFAHVFHLIS